MKINQHKTGRGHGYGHPSTGPLMTGHLQVRNLDRELKLLRYKREVVQREQQLLSIECEMDRKRQYEQMNRNGSNAFGSAWQPPPPKRANVPRHPSPWVNPPPGNFEPNFSKHVPANYIPSLMSKKFNPPLIPVPMKPIVHPILNNAVSNRIFKPVNVRKDFRPSQVTKKKPRAAPLNKLNSYSVAERKNLVSQATGLQLAKNNTSKTPKETNPDMVLRQDQIPNRQVVGRLELALGNLVKEIKCSNDDDETFKILISKPTHQRLLKQFVRERIRTVMLNKPVGSVADIVDKYREKFPKQTDKDIIDLVTNSEQHKVVNVIETESPEEFFKKNITRILEKKIQEMSLNLQKMYTKIRHKLTFAYTNAPEEGTMKQDESSEKESILDNETSLKDLNSLTDKLLTTEERKKLTQYYTELIENILDEKLPEYLPKCKDVFIKIFDLDHQFKTIRNIAIKRVKDDLKSMKADPESLNTQNETIVEILDDNETLIKNDDGNKIDTIVIEDKNMEDEVLVENKEMEVEETIENDNAPNETLPENIPDTEITADDNKAQEVLAETPGPIMVEEVASVQKSPTHSPEAVEPTTPISKKIESSQTVPKTPITVSTPAGKELPYYVKLIGRPKLPNRAVICDFLNGFKPNSIKKHKSINNLLVIGFLNQEDYNKILTANETVIGDTTIIIKTSEKVSPGKENEPTKEDNDVNGDQKESINKDVVRQEVKDENGTATETKDTSYDENQKDLIGKDLDDQITDLLTTIQQSEQEATQIKKETPTEMSKDSPQEIDKPKETLGPIQESEVENVKEMKADAPNKSTKVNMKESGRATPVRSSSRLSNVTPSTIRTRRASRLLQE